MGLACGDYALLALFEAKSTFIFVCVTTQVFIFIRLMADAVQVMQIHAGAKRITQQSDVLGIQRIAVDSLASGFLGEPE